jgi:hypothetical protein
MTQRSRRIRTRLARSLGLCVVALALVGLAPSTAAAAVPSTSALSYGTDGQVDAIATLGDAIYLGGNFTHIGLATGGGAAFAAADGQADASMPAVSGGAHTVDAVVPDGSGGWYIGGGFTHVGGVARNNLAHVLAGGSVDPTFNPNANGQVYALAVSGSTLYAGGQFNGPSSIGGADRNFIAALDATTGEATSWNPNATDAVLTLAVDGSTVYAGGQFDNIGGEARNDIAALDATTGTATSWDPSANHPVRALAVSGSTVYAGGDFHGVTSIGGADRNYIAALDATTGNATSWDPNASGGVGTSVDALAISGSTVYAGGRFTSIGGQPRSNIAALDASGNATIWDPNSLAPVDALGVSGSTVYAGGQFTNIGGEARNHIAALDATTGTATSWDPNTSDVVNALAISGSTIYAGGAFSIVNQLSRNNLAALDATTLRPTTWDPHADQGVYALAVSDSTVYAGGQFNGPSSIGGVDRNFIAALDPTTGAVDPNFNPNANNVVRALAVSGSTVYAGGQFNGASSIGGATRNRIAALDASTGTATSFDPNANGTVRALAVSGSTVYAGGDFNGASSIGGAARNRIAALDATTGAATSWDPNANGTVWALAVDGSTVYAGGDFNGASSIGAAARNRIAALDATTGNATSFDPNASGGVYALAVDGSTVYAGGGFSGPSSIGGADRNRLAALDATTGNATSWDPNANDEVDAVLASPGVVYAGGLFSGIEAGSGASFAAFVAPPANTVLPSISGTPVAGHTLTCANGSWSGTPQSYAYQWLRDNVAISGQTATTYAVQPGDSGHVIKCRVTATNLGGSTNATSNGTTILTAPHNTAAPTISGNPVAGHTLICNKGTWTGSAPITYAYRWLRNGVGIVGATSSTYVVKSADIGKQLRCRVTASNGAGSTIATSAVTVIKTPPKNTVAPKITGTPKVGKTLTCSNGTWTGSAPITYTRQWLRNGAPIAGATGSAYVAKAADKNKFLTCRVTAHNAAGTATKTSAAVKVS